MDFMKMLEDWRRILGRSVFVFHIMSVVMGVVLLLSVMSLPYLSGGSPVLRLRGRGSICLLR